jgi:putative peptidoglycan lipid II flippase
MALLRNIATVGGWTMASRVLGFIRDVLIAQAIGTGNAADAFFVSQRFPNLFRSLFAEGAFNASFVPQFARRLEGEGQESARQFAEQVAAVMTTALLIFTFVAQAGMPWLMYLLAGGYADNPEKFALSVLLTQITFPYLLFMSLTALQGGILNSLHQYMHAAAAPILLNVVMILALLFVEPFVGMPAHVLAWAMTVAGVAQFLWMVIACQKVGMALRFPRPRLTPDVKKLLKLMVPGIIGSGVMQINLVIGTQIASWQDAAVSYLTYADRIYQFPLAVFGSAAGVVLLPELSRHLRAGRDGDAMASFNRGIEYVLLLTLPSAVALMAIPLPVMDVLFQRGAFTAADSAATALALAIYSAGLPAFVMVKALTPGFYAREDTATPFRYAIISMIVNTILSVALFFVMGYAGIALATVIASWLNILMLGHKLHRQGNLVIDSKLRRSAPRIALASLVMGAVLLAGQYGLQDALAASFLIKASALAALIIAGVAVFFGVAFLTGAVSFKDLKRALGRS